MILMQFIYTGNSTHDKSMVYRSIRLKLTSFLATSHIQSLLKASHVSTFYQESMIVFKAQVYIRGLITPITQLRQVLGLHPLYAHLRMCMQDGESAQIHPTCVLWHMFWSCWRYKFRKVTSRSLMRKVNHLWSIFPLLPR
jgi:hypothetical protein